MEKITGIVVCFNEKAHLRSCLESLSFCDELLFVDLGSTDGSLEIAKQFTESVISIPKVNYVELALVQAVNFAQNDWVISLDPDEVFSSKLSEQIKKIINKDNNLAKIFTPWKFYFLGRPLNGTIWGVEKYKDRVFNKRKVTISPLVHEEIIVLHGFHTTKIPFEPDNFIKHYWCDSLLNLFEKHWRYIKNEGRARYTNGKRFSMFKMLWSVFYSLVNNLIRHQGFKEGFWGVFLSLFYAWYEGMSHLSLLQYQMAINSRKDNHDFVKE